MYGRPEKDVQEEGKLSDLLKWLTLPTLASTIAINVSLQTNSSRLKLGIVDS